VALLDVKPRRRDNPEPGRLGDAPQPDDVAPPRLHRDFDHGVGPKTLELRQLANHHGRVVEYHQTAVTSPRAQPIGATPALVAQDVLVCVGNPQRLWSDWTGHRLDVGHGYVRRPSSISSTALVLRVRIRPPTTVVMTKPWIAHVSAAQASETTMTP
jgi:hypothetical protein